MKFLVELYLHTTYQTPYPNLWLAQFAVSWQKGLSAQGFFWASRTFSRFWDQQHNTLRIKLVHMILHVCRAHFQTRDGRPLNSPRVADLCRRESHDVPFIYTFTHVIAGHSGAYFMTMRRIQSWRKTGETRDATEAWIRGWATAFVAMNCCKVTNRSEIGRLPTRALMLNAVLQIWICNTLTEVDPSNSASVNMQNCGYRNANFTSRTRTCPFPDQP